MNRKQRMRNALWGLFIGDALAMPAHWYYDRKNIERDFDGGIRGYAAAPHPHPESFMVGMAYRPDVETARRLGRPFDILHDHVRFYSTTYSDLDIELAEREGQHGNATPSLEDRYHYHHGLKAGENTLAPNLARVLMRAVADRGGYEPDDFLAGFVEYLATPGRNRDPYCEIYIRRWFENYTRGRHPHACAEEQRNVWSIGSHGGMIRPLVLSLLFDNAYQALGFAIEHQNLTHRSENVAAALGVAVPLLQDLLDGRDPWDEALRKVRVPRVTGEELFARYRANQGPGNIPADEMWRLHTELVDEPVRPDRLASACYPEHGFPLMLALVREHAADFERTLLASANFGGDNVHRTAVLGMLVGAAQDELPSELVSGLADAEAIGEEIEAFVASA
ncbi:MAG: ADP-ribosylglycohydrolase family protein [Planctomycetota bacterium]|jgi:ADP-ribosylglycohydrolase